MQNVVTLTDEQEMQHIRDLFENTVSKKLIVSELGSRQADPNLTELIQPKSITYSVLPKSQVAIDVLTETIRSLQPFMAYNPDNCIPGNAVNQFFVTIDFRNIAGFHESRKDIEMIIKELKTINFTFSWTQKAFTDETGKIVPQKKFDYDGILFIGHLQENTGYNYKLHINPLALPYLTFVGRGMGYTKFSYEDYSQLNCAVTKKLYQLICDWTNQNMTNKSISVNELKTLLSIPESMAVNKIRCRYIDKLKNILLNNGSSILFDYEITHSNSDKRDRTTGRKKNDTFVFHFNSQKDKASLYNVKIQAIKLSLSEISEREKDEMENLIEIIQKDNKVDFLYNKISFYFDQRKENAISKDEYKNTVLKIIRESLGVDLRSNDHIRNAGIKALEKLR